MQAIKNPSVEQIQVWLAASHEVSFQTEGRADIYAWGDRTLRQQDYPKLSRANKGLLRRFVMKMTGLSPSQVTRIIGQFDKTQLVRATVYRWRRFPRRNTAVDVALLVEVDQIRGATSETSPQAARREPRCAFAVVGALLNCPLHLLAFGEALTDDLVRRRFHELRRNRFFIPPPFAVVRNASLVERRSCRIRPDLFSSSARCHPRFLRYSSSSAGLAPCPVRAPRSRATGSVSCSPAASTRAQKIGCQAINSMILQTEAGTGSRDSKIEFVASPCSTT